MDFRKLEAKDNNVQLGGKATTIILLLLLTLVLGLFTSMQWRPSSVDVAGSLTAAMTIPASLQAELSEMARKDNEILAQLKQLNELIGSGETSSGLRNENLQETTLDFKGTTSRMNTMFEDPSTYTTLNMKGFYDPWNPAEGLPDDPQPPHLKIAERDLFLHMLRQATSWFEYGGGGSTVAISNYPTIKKAHTVESDEGWVNILAQRHDISAAVKSGRQTLEHGNIGPVGQWGTPKKNYQADVPDYVENYPNRLAQVDPPPGGWTHVFVDGRFRVACVLNAVKNKHLLARDVTIMVHDYSWRPGLKVIEKYVDRTALSTATLMVFKIKPSIDIKALDADIEIYNKKHTVHGLPKE